MVDPFLELFGVIVLGVGLCIMIYLIGDFLVGIVEQLFFDRSE